MKPLRRNRTIEIDMTGVGVGGRLCPEGIHKVQVEDVTPEVSASSEKPYLAWKFRTVDGSYRLYHNTSLQPQALFNLKQVLIALGVEVPNSVMRLNLDEVVGRKCYVEVEHEMYEGKKRARIIDFLAKDAVEEFEDDEEEEVEWEAAGGEEEEEEEGEEEGEEEEDELDRVSLDELLEYAEEHDIDLTHLGKKGRKNRDKVLQAIRAALEEAPS